MIYIQERRTKMLVRFAEMTRRSRFNMHARYSYVLVYTYRTHTLYHILLTRMCVLFAHELVATAVQSRARSQDRLQ